MADYGLFILTGPGLDDGCWLAAYDPDAYEGGGMVEGSDDPAEAMRFPDVMAAMEEWKRPSTVRPLRADGKPNRPLSAFTVQPKRLPPYETALEAMNAHQRSEASEDESVAGGEQLPPQVDGRPGPASGQG
jgi:hypothetical protein